MRQSMLNPSKARAMTSASPQSAAAARPTDPVRMRQQIRSGNHTGHTAGYAPGYVQANICILPQDWANEFLDL